MKTVISLLIFLLYSQVCNSQQNILWQRIYQGPYDEDDTGYDICQSTDGNFYLAGGVTGWQIWPRFYVIKINPYGQKLWAKEIPGINGTGYAYCVTSTLEGGCVVSGDAARFVKLSANGDELANTLPQDGVERRIYDIQRTADNFFIACGRYNVNHSLIIKFDSIGNIIWHKVFPSIYKRELRKIEEAFNGGYIAIGTKVNSFTDTVRSNIVRTDTSVILLWERDYINAGGYTLEKNKNYYLISGGNVTARIDTSGNLVRSTFINGLNIYESLNDMRVLSINRYIYCTQIPNFQGQVYSRVFTTDTLGNLINSKLFDKSEFTVLTSISKINENNVVFFGSTYYDTIQKSNYYAIRTDSIFNVPPVGIKNESNLISNEFVLYQNFPNPFNNSTVIEFDVVKDEYYTLEIYNCLGQSVSKLFQEYKKKGTYKIIFSPEAFSSGLYFYKLYNGNVSLTKLLILLK